MEYRELGKTGLKISTLGFGGIPIQRIDAAGTKVLMNQLVEAGVNYIDTARGYTVSESYLGEALEGIRDKFVLATKSMARTADAMAADVQTSLTSLRTDYIDLYQIHNPTLAPGGRGGPFLTNADPNCANWSCRQSNRRNDIAKMHKPTIDTFRKEW